MGRLFEGGDYFKYYHQRGAINRGTAIILGNTVSITAKCLFNGLRRRSNIVNFMSSVMISDLDMSCMTVVEI